MGVEGLEDADALVKPRLEKLSRLRNLGIEPYPEGFARTHTCSQALAEHPDGQDGSKVLRLAGRMVRLNRMGKSSFAHIRDGSGAIQLYLQADRLGEESYGRFLDLFDLGDFVGAEGALFTTRTGEVTLRVNAYWMLSKSLRPLPEKFHGLTDPETRYRQRYLDLIANEDVRRTFQTRAAVVGAIRRFLDDRGYIEVETPILQPAYGGASARPFITHYNVLDRDYYLRIADELYLKRLLVGGYEKVYEFCKDFRNEGIDRTHIPEFTMMECYEAYADYKTIMDLTESMVFHAAQAVAAFGPAENEDGCIDFTPPWERITFRDATLRETGIDIEEYADGEGLACGAKELGLKCDASLGKGHVLDQILEKLVTPKIVAPTFICDYPVETSPLAKRLKHDQRYVGRFEAMAAGMKFANAFSELNDPLEQRRRFEDQAKRREWGDEEAQVLDEDFLTALEHGMPPAGGLGIGIDRLVMLLTGRRNIREVILFPQLRSKA